MRHALPWILLLASNLAWGAYVVLRPAPEVAPERLTLPTTPAAAPGEGAGDARTAPRLEGAPPTASRPPAGSAGRHDPTASNAARAEEQDAAAARERLREAARAHQAAVAASRERVERIKADILQIEDPARRDAGVGALHGALSSDEPEVVAAALRSLYDLRDAAFDKAGLRPRVLARLADPNAAVRAAALYALLQVPRGEGDLERVLALLEDEAPPSHAALHVATMLGQNRVEGRLATVYVKALEQPDAATAIDVANLLRGMWVAPEVEEAVLATWRRTKDDPGGGLWNHILGQIEPTREPRVRVIFEILRQDRTDAPQLLERALSKRNLDPTARRTAVDLALEGLGTAPNAMVRRLMLSVVEAHGQGADAARLRAFGDNPMVAEDLRARAQRIADGLR